MADAMDIHGTAFKNGSITLLARIVDGNGEHVVQSDIAAAKCTVYLLDGQDPDSRAAVAAHTNVPVPVADVVFDTLQTDATWTVDTTGYNFRHTIDVSAHQAFAVAGRRYLVEYQLSPASGQTILVRFRLNVI